MKRIAPGLIQLRSGFLMIEGDESQNRSVMNMHQDLIDFSSFRWVRLFRRLMR